MEAERVALAARTEEDRQHAEELAGQAKEVAERERFAREQTEKKLRDSAGAITSLRNDLAEAQQQVVNQKKLGRRKGWLAALLVMCGCLVIVSLALALYLLAGVTVLTMLAVWKQGEDWIKDPDRNARGVLAAVLVEALGLSQLFVHW
jgi:Flp pilus assembly protein TadB